MTSSTQKVIAREGLCIVGILAVSLFCVVFGEIGRHIFKSDTTIRFILANVEVFGLLLFLCGCPVYLIVRFTFWALKILAREEPASRA